MKSFTVLRRLHAVYHKITLLFVVQQYVYQVEIIVKGLSLEGVGEQWMLHD